MYRRIPPSETFIPLLPVIEEPTPQASIHSSHADSTITNNSGIDLSRPSSTMATILPTPFDTPLPSKIARRYWANTNSGRAYALYSLVHMSKDDMSELLQAMRFHAEHDTTAWTCRVARAPIHDFCSNHKTLRDIYDYHISLIDGNDQGYAAGRILVVTHQDWEDHGLLLVDFDCDPHDRGVPGMMRCDVGVLSRCLMLLERSNANWSDLKATELETHWSEPIIGYTGSDTQRFGYSRPTTDHARAKYT